VLYSSSRARGSGERVIVEERKQLQLRLRLGASCASSKSWPVLSFWRSSSRRSCKDAEFLQTRLADARQLAPFPTAGEGEVTCFRAPFPRLVPAIRHSFHLVQQGRLTTTCFALLRSSKRNSQAFLAQTTGKRRWLSSRFRCVGSSTASKTSTRSLTSSALS